MTFDFLLDSRGYIKKRESFDLEFKQSFQMGDNLLKYAKTLVGMANNKGGQIIFGIQDKPHVPVGMKKRSFQEIDPVKIDQNIREYFSQEIEWEMNVLQFDGKEFGQISVKEAHHKPIISKKNKDSILREGAIYYRYRAETKEIEFAELYSILNAEREKERDLWMSHIQKIAKIGVKNVSLLDSFKGELNIGESKILLDKKVLKDIKFIQEGKFTEKDGEGFPTLRLIGNIEGIVDESVVLQSDHVYPLFTKDLQTQLGLNSYQLMCLMWELKIKGNNKFHTEVKSGKKSNYIQKYSKITEYYLRDKMRGDEFLENCLQNYKLAHPFIKKETKK
jgi:hypothetical protein